MSFSKYKSISDVLREFPLSYYEESFVQKRTFEIDSYFKKKLNFSLQQGVVFNSEASICEKIIYPILSEIWQQYADQLLLWSHEPLNYDDNLSGIPDYIIARRSPRGKIILDQPYLILVKAKKDNFDEGWGQCLTELIAGQKLNNDSNKRLYGIVSNGKLWEFGMLQVNDFTKNITNYILDDLETLMGAINFVFAESVAQIEH
jgi:hypothetical protein